MHRLAVALLLLTLVGCGAPRAIRHPGLPAALPLATDADQRAAFAEGYRAFQHDDLDAALAVFQALAKGYPALGDYHLYFIGVIQERRGEPGDAQTAFRRLLRRYPASVKALPAAVALGRLLVDDGELDEARPLLQRALGAADAVTVRRARLALARADERSGDRTAAYAGFMAVRREAPGTQAGREAKAHVTELRAHDPAFEPTGADRLDEARLLLAEQDYPAAQALAAAIVEHPEDTDPAAAMRVHADALFREGKVEAALTALWRITDRYPDRPAAPDAWFRMATILWNRDRDEVALQAFEQLRRRYPSSAHVPDALYASGRIHEKAGRAPRALQLYGEVTRRFPGHKVAPEARWRIGWIQYRDRNWSAAAAAFATLAHHTAGQTADGALYWQGRALAAAGRTHAARELYRRVLERNPTGYYALWAQRRLDGSLHAPLLVPTTVTQPAPEDPGPPPFTDSFHLPRWQELRAAGVTSLARGELAAIERTQPEDAATLRFLFRAYQITDAYTETVRLLRRLNGGASLSESERLRLAYPLAYWDIVERETQAHGVDPLLVEALMRQESLFDPEARSPADARGLMQLLPSTAARLAAAADRHIDEAALFEPGVNIPFGVRYLRDLFARYTGDPLKALAAYNGGEAAVDRWVRQFGRLEPDEFVESITYRETRHYVKRVLGNYQEYLQLYGDGGVSGPSR